MTKSAPWLIVGLGNPGAKYDNTLHNVGRETVELLAAQNRENLRRHRSGTLVATTHFGLGAPNPTTVLLAVARNYMNVSGPPYANLAKAFKVPTEQILAIHDDLDLRPHELRLKMGGGEGGHNGLRSLSKALGTKDYARLRIGIGRPPGTTDAARYVLAPIPMKQREEWEVTIEQAAQIAKDVVLEGFLKAQMDLHSRE